MILRGASERSPAVRVVHITSVHDGSDVRICLKECPSLACAGYEVIELTNHAQDTQCGGVRIRGLGRSRARHRAIANNPLPLNARCRSQGDRPKSRAAV